MTVATETKQRREDPRANAGGAKSRQLPRPEGRSLKKLG